MSIESLVDELESAKSFDIVDVRAKIEKAWAAAATSEQRGTVLAIFKATMDAVERNLAGRGDQAQLLADIQKGPRSGLQDIPLSGMHRRAGLPWRR